MKLGDVINVMATVASSCATCGAIVPRLGYAKVEDGKLVGVPVDDSDCNECLRKKQDEYDKLIRAQRWAKRMSKKFPSPTVPKGERG